MYDAQMGRKNVQLQVSEMGLMVFEKKSGSKIDTYLYKSLTRWGADDEGNSMTITTEDGEKRFKTDEAKKITEGMTKHAKA